jgi:hypothetical protein
MWVYRKINDGSHLLYVVGFYSPNYTWMPATTYAVEEEAAARVNYLNGGNVPLVDAEIVPVLTDKDKAVEAAELLASCDITADVMNVFCNELGREGIQRIIKAAQEEEQ